MTRAIAFTEFGSADVLRPTEIELPSPGPGQARIAVRTAGVNPIDHKIRSGLMEQVFPVTFPHVPGVEAAGTVEELGPGVIGLDVGDEVLGPTLTGAYAEQALAAADRLTVKPASLGWEQAAALPVAAETAFRALEFLDLREGETLLVHGAAGGVGTLAVQFARSRGVRVIGTASEANHGYLRELGATAVRYGEGLAERVRAVADGGVDAALDAVGKGEAIAASLELTGDSARVVTLADPQGAQRHHVHFTTGADGNRTREGLAAALDLFEAGTLLLPVHRTYPLDRAAEAQRASEHGHLTGKIVLTVA